MLAKKAAKPASANNWLVLLKRMTAFGLAQDLMAHDPARDVPFLRRKSAGLHSWTEGEIAQFETRHPVGSKARLALGLLLYTAQRRGDVLVMGPQHVRNGVVHVRQNKTGTTLEIELHTDLKAILDATPTEHLTFLTTAYGKPFSPGGFSNWFRDRVVEAGLPPKCTAHGLRKAAARRLAEAGCSANVIAAVTGHRSLREVERYTKAADQARLARQGIAAISKRARE
jgi:integrase